MIQQVEASKTGSSNERTDIRHGRLGMIHVPCHDAQVSRQVIPYLRHNLTPKVRRTRMSYHPQVMGLRSSSMTDIIRGVLIVSSLLAFMAQPAVRAQGDGQAEASSPAPSVSQVIDGADPGSSTQLTALFDPSSASLSALRFVVGESIQLYDEAPQRLPILSFLVSAPREAGDAEAGQEVRIDQIELVNTLGRTSIWLLLKSGERTLGWARAGSLREPDFPSLTLSPRDASGIEDGSASNEGDVEADS